RFADLQTEASRSRASFQHHWNVETADFDFDSLAASEIEALKHFYAPYYRPVPPDSAGGTLAQGLRGARASALGSQSEDLRQDPDAPLMSPTETPYFRVSYIA